MKQGDLSVREYNTLFLKSGLHGKHGEETLVSMYREGLREEIRSEIGSKVFSSIDDIIQAALDVEEGETPSDTNGSPTKSSDTNGSPTESDESGNRPKKKARTKNNEKNDQVDEEEEDEAEAEHDEIDADNDSDLSRPNQLEGSDDESDSKVDLQDYKEYLEEHHKSDNIKGSLESTEFATLGSLFEEATEVEAILEKEKSPQKSPGRRKRKTRPNSFMDPEDEDPLEEPGVEDGEESDDDESVDENNDEEWVYEGETLVEVDEDEMSDHGSDEKTRMSTVLSSPDEETDHGRDENTHDASGAGESPSSLPPSLTPVPLAVVPLLT
ncbi:hypothetical protein Bca52824_016623 [Brassica carinata]|uniref:Uncharacterized protein n=1 Tax=Brassica carinata TaxID=52824 RepID=A0A8X8B5L6_BRACI|nr:hypothetical protein Bca52824_016623 [Brassica carinata]